MSKFVPLAKLTQFVLDGTHGSPERTEDPNGVPLLSAKNILDGEIRWDNFDRVPVHEWKDFCKRLTLQPGDVLMTCVGTIGRATVWNTNRPAVLLRSVAVLRPTDCLNPKFLEYCVRSSPFQHSISQRIKQASQGGIYLEDIRELPLPVVPLSEQERIVRILDAAEELRRLRACADRRTADLSPALFCDMFGDPAANPKAWRFVPVGRISSVVTSGFTPRGGSQVYVEEGPYLIRSQNVQMNMLDLSDAACLPKDVHESMARVRVQVQDVLLNITGASIGRVAWVESLDREASVNQHVCIIRPLTDVAHPAYISVCLSTDFGKRMIDQVQAGASRQGLNHQQVRQLEIPLPPLSLQRQFAARVAEIRALEARQAESRHRLDDLFQSLLHRAFRGEL